MASTAQIDRIICRTDDGIDRVMQLVFVFQRQTLRVAAGAGRGGVKRNREPGFPVSPVGEVVEASPVSVVVVFAISPQVSAVI